MIVRGENAQLCAEKVGVVINRFRLDRFSDFKFSSHLARFVLTCPS